MGTAAGVPVLSKRSNRTRGNRPVNMGRSLRARQMKPGPIRKRPAGTIWVDTYVDGLIDEILGQYLISEDGVVLIKE